jgi:hypothetical protein
MSEKFRAIEKITKELLDEYENPPIAPQWAEEFRKEIIDKLNDLMAVLSESNPNALVLYSAYRILEKIERKVEARKIYFKLTKILVGKNKEEERLRQTTQEVEELELLRELMKQQLEELDLSGDEDARHFLKVMNRDSEFQQQQPDDH